MANIMFSPSEELFRQSKCACCQEPVPGIGIECLECPAKLRLCCECYGLGAEIGQHKVEHKYCFFDSSGNVEVFPNPPPGSESDDSGDCWKARDHIRLLDAIEQYGFGNWQDISKFVESKTAAECKEEYVRRFVRGSIGITTWREREFHKVQLLQRPIDYTLPDDGPLSPVLAQKLPQLDINSDEGAQLGYMPKRDDYEKEYDNDAEKLVSQLVFNHEDDENDVALKLSLVDMYSKRLRERVRRKRVIRDYQLVGKFFKKERGPGAGGINGRRRFQTYERDLQEKYKPFAQFHSAIEHSSFIENLVKERELRFRLQELYKYRRNGITRISDCAEYERYRVRKRNATKGLAAAAVATGGTLAGIPEEDRSASVVGIGTRSQMNQMMNHHHQHQQSPAERRNDAEPYFHIKNPIVQPSSCVAINSNYVELPYGQRTLQQIELPHLGMEQGVGQVAGAAVAEVEVGTEHEQNLLLHQRAGGPKVMVDQFIVDENIENYPSAPYLLDSELDLCTNINILPAEYLTIKTRLLIDPDIEKPIQLSDSEWKQIHGFMIDSGWLELE